MSWQSGRANKLDTSDLLPLLLCTGVDNAQVDNRGNKALHNLTTLYIVCNLIMIKFVHCCSSPGADALQRKVCVPSAFVNFGGYVFMRTM